LTDCIHSRATGRPCEACRALTNRERIEKLEIQLTTIQQTIAYHPGQPDLFLNARPVRQADWDELQSSNDRWKERAERAEAELTLQKLHLKEMTAIADEWRRLADARAPVKRAKVVRPPTPKKPSKSSLKTPGPHEKCICGHGYMYHGEKGTEGCMQCNDNCFGFQPKKRCRLCLTYGYHNTPCEYE
jgi:hypothetical protein